MNFDTIRLIFTGRIWVEELKNRIMSLNKVQRKLLSSREQWSTMTGRRHSFVFFSLRIRRRYFLEIKRFFFHTNFIFISFAVVTIFAWLFFKYTLLTILCIFLTKLICSWVSRLSLLHRSCYRWYLRSDV